MQAQGTAIRSQGHLEQAGQDPGTDVQDVTQLQPPAGSYLEARGSSSMNREERHVPSSTAVGILTLLLRLSLNPMRVTSKTEHLESLLQLTVLWAEPGARAVGAGEAAVSWTAAGQKPSVSLSCSRTNITQTPH